MNLVINENKTRYLVMTRYMVNKAAFKIDFIHLSKCTNLNTYKST